LYKTGRARPFIAFRNFEASSVLVVEGEKKAMVAAHACRKGGINCQVIGMPSKTPDAQAIENVRSFEDVYLCLDPDARETEKGVSALDRMVKMIDKPVKVVNLPGKVDDMINQNGLDIVDALRYAK
jgi:hypothetical protein